MPLADFITEVTHLLQDHSEPDEFPLEDWREAAAEVRWALKAVSTTGNYCLLIYRRALQDPTTKRSLPEPV